MTTISILGCGWLGVPLAEALIKANFRVKGSTTSAQKQAVLTQKGIEPYVISLQTDGVLGEITAFLDQSALLIIAIPPKLRRNSSENFVAKIQQLLPYIENSGVQKVLFISSTSVYSDTNEIITEKSAHNPSTEAGKQLLVIEGILQNNPHFSTTILRFAGLVGADRNPVHFLAGKENLENPEAPINLIHQEDCIGIILKIISTNTWNQVFNAAADYHPSRAAYYTQKAVALDLVPPSFSRKNPSVGKTINSDTLKNTLNYLFIKNEL
ncbi:NAD(P)-dependent oxidoreductase [Flavobacterium crassostreae]|uniref:NAD(P)-dependent oxidoreductase n=1 Tax=Flavobacterium crassostreae TaxID=1763534 RepID=A0A1B9E0D7_9FLAO|nr:NAD(P)-dependent oxidoreductase [Flavobacterium crassostreae]OCB75391.1 NAD(P)-dependent oxidoreductase [Flavobacterium crassostreae]